MKPASIHDPITPEQAYHLPCFYWNVRDTARDAELLAEKKARNRAKYEQQKARRQERREALLAASSAALAAKAIGKARMPDPHERLAHAPRVRKGRMA